MKIPLGALGGEGPKGHGTVASGATASVDVDTTVGARADASPAEAIFEEAAVVRTRRHRFLAELGEFRRSRVLVAVATPPGPETGEVPLTVDMGEVRWILAFTGEAALARCAACCRRRSRCTGRDGLRRRRGSGGGLRWRGRNECGWRTRSAGRQAGADCRRDRQGSGRVGETVARRRRGPGGHGTRLRHIRATGRSPFATAPSPPNRYSRERDVSWRRPRRFPVWKSHRVSPEWARTTTTRRSMRNWA